MIKISEVADLLMQVDNNTDFIYYPSDERFVCTEDIDIEEMYDDAGEMIEVAPHPQQIVKMKMAKPVEPYTILRRDV